MRTSVNLRAVDIPKLLEASDKSGVSTSVLINLCLQKYFSVKPVRLKTAYANNLVEYQPDGVGYFILNVVFLVSVYNLAVNFRCFSRLSVSMMVTLAINGFLDEVVRQIEQGEVVSHNYVTYEYLKRHNIGKNRYDWLIVWTLGEKIDKQQAT